MSTYAPAGIDIKQMYALKQSEIKLIMSSISPFEIYNNKIENILYYL